MECQKLSLTKIHSVVFMTTIKEAIKQKNVIHLSIKHCPSLRDTIEKNSTNNLKGKHVFEKPKLTLKNIDTMYLFLPLKCKLHEARDFCFLHCHALSPGKSAYY